MKRNILANPFGLDFILQLRPVTYQYDYNILKKYRIASSDRDSLDTFIAEPEKSKVHTGFIAQEVLEAANNIGFDFSGLVIPEADNQLMQLQYEAFVMPLINSIKEMTTKNKMLSDKIEILKAKIVTLNRDK